MPTIAEVRARWAAKRLELARLGALVQADALLRDVCDDLAALEHAEAEDVLTLQQASDLGGYSVDHLQRCVAKGSIPNAGRRGSPRIRRQDVPRRPGYVAPVGLPDRAAGSQLDARLRVVRPPSPPQTDEACDG